MSEGRPMTLEDFTQAWATVLERSRGDFWLLGDLASWRLKQERTKAGRGQVVRLLAESGHCTAAWVRMHVQCADAFGTEQRLPDVSQSLYLACVRAAKRTARKAGDILDDALAGGHHAAWANRLGRDAAAVARTLEATCLACGLEVRLRLLDGADTRSDEPALPCPRCVAWAWTIGREAREVERLGVLP